MVQNTSEEKSKGQIERRRSTLKAVIRHLPPSMTAAEFISAIEPLPDHNYFWYEEADMSLGPHAFSRAYINFKEKEDIELFTDKFDGYVFIDSKGNEYPASVEFAPFQKVSKFKVTASAERQKGKSRDLKVATIEEDPEYLAFIESLKESKAESNLPSAEIYLEEMEKKAKELKENHGCPKMLTPLLEYVLNKKSEKSRPMQELRNQRRDRREERVRQKGKQDQSKISIDTRNKPSRNDRRRDRRRDHRDGDGSKVVEKPKEIKNLRLLKKEEVKSMSTNKNQSKNPTVLDTLSVTGDQVKAAISTSSTNEPLPPIGKSTNNERHETELKKPITGKPSHATSTSPSKGRRDERRNDERRRNDVRKEERKEENKEDYRELKKEEPRRETAREGPKETKNEATTIGKSYQRGQHLGEGRKTSSSEKHDRVRNKDRPDIPRYQPKIRGEPNKNESSTVDGEGRESTGDSGPNRKVRARVFTRTRRPDN